jgi:hypothetical protein
MRSCSLLVRVHEATKEIASVDSGRLVHAGERQSDGWIRRLQPERPVRMVGVIVLDVDPQHLLGGLPTRVLMSCMNAFAHPTGSHASSVTTSRPACGTTMAARSLERPCSLSMAGMSITSSTWALSWDYVSASSVNR